MDVSIGIDLAGGKDANHTLEGTYQLDDTRQEVRATVGPGEITIRDEEQQAALESEGATDPLADLNRDPDRAYEITRDKHVEIEAYISTQSLKAAAEGVEIVGRAIGDAFEALAAKLASSGDLTPQEWETVRKVAQALDDGNLDLEALAACSGRQGFNLLDLIFTPARAATGCVLFDQNGKEIAELTPNEREACIQMLATLMEKYAERYVTGETGKGEMPDSVKALAAQLRKIGTDEQAVMLFQTMGMSAGFLRDLALRMALEDEAYKEYKNSMEALAQAGDLTKEAAERTIEAIADKHGLSAQDIKDLKLVTGATFAAASALLGGAKLRLGSHVVKHPPQLSISNSQWGKKIGYHMVEFGLDVSNPNHRMQFREFVENIGSNPENVLKGAFLGQGPGGSRGDVLFYIKGKDVVVTSPSGEFVKILHNGINNTSVKASLK